MAESKKSGQKLSNIRSRGTKRNEDLSNYIFGKVQPQALPLEEAVLGALMLDKEALAIILDILQPESFYLDAHQLIYRAMLRLFERSQPVDLLTVTEELKKNGELESTGGPHYLVELTDKVASSANIEYHARLIAQKHIQRELIRVSTQIIRNAYEDTTDVFDLLDEAEQGLFNIAQRNMNRSYESMGSLASKLQKQLEELKTREDGLTGIPTGFTDLDRLTSGWQASDLIIVAARPGMGKCLGKGTNVLMYDGSLKKVEDIKVGDLLMGDDSTPRRVLSLARGREKMYWIRQNKGIDYRVNESHILSLKKSCEEGKGERGSVLDISVKELLQCSKKFRSNYKGYKVPVDFPEKKVPLAPYFLGLWLGDGTTDKNEISTRDEEVIAYLADYADALDLPLKSYEENPRKCPRYSISGGYTGNKGYSLKVELRNIGVLGNKHIPRDFLVNSTEKRLELLAGLIDSDGHYLTQSNGYSITLKDDRLIRDIKFLCDTLGFRTTLKPRIARIKSLGYETTVYRLRIYGDIERIPVRIERKKANSWRSRVDWQVTGIRIEPDIVDDYYGFEIDGNGRFLLEDMTVTHNTSFTLSLAKNAAVDFGKGVAVFSLEMSSLQLVQRLVSMEAEISGSKMRNGKLEDYEWEQLQAAIERLSDAPIYIDDTPGINIFEIRAKARRLKMQHDIHLVIIDYLQLMSGGSENQRGNREQEISAISRSLKGLAKELEIPVIALSQLSRAVEVRGGTKRPQLSDLRECITGSSKIFLPEQCRWRTVDSLLDKKNFGVLSINEQQELVEDTCTEIWPTGEKDIFELQTRPGNYIRCSEDHPFLTPQGWSKLSKLREGDLVATTRSVEKRSSGITLEENHLAGSPSAQVNPSSPIASDAALETSRPGPLPEQQMVWEEISSLRHYGREMTYDLHVQNHHNFVADNFIVHNSGAIEQDADIVSFIYRPEYYQILEDEEGQSLKGVAEIIVAKHRNGALDTIKLRFTDKYARFTDLDEPDFDDLGEAFENPNVNVITRPSKMNDDEDIPF
jgi:replicative DNA helicase